MQLEGVGDAAPKSRRGGGAEDAAEVAKKLRELAAQVESTPANRCAVDTDGGVDNNGSRSCSGLTRRVSMTSRISTTSHPALRSGSFAPSPLQPPQKRRAFSLGDPPFALFDALEG